ncbi:MAG: fasciclin domain-containing protein [Chitinophagaceae bacterium]|nr:fasciclin domain-containing protein [Chitinophagaceae bacterium]
MKKIFKTLNFSLLVILSGIFFLTSCNKDLEQFAPIPTPTYPTGSGIAATLAANSNYSFYNALITRADSGAAAGTGLRATLNDLTKTFTLFTTDNAGMKLFVNSQSGGLVPLTAPDATFLGFIGANVPVASAAGIVQYHMVGQKFTASSFGSAFPNYPLTSQIILDPAQPFVRMPIFPVKGTTYSYVNTMPLTTPEIVAANGVIHTTFSVVAPLPAKPLVTLRTLINADASLTYFKAAIARADSGQVGISGVGPFGLQFDSLMNYPVTNMTVLAPNNTAFQTLIFGLVYSQVLAATGSTSIATTQANAAVAAGPAFLNTNNVSTALMRGVVAYHILASNNTGSYKPDIRAFSVNFSPTVNSFAKTLVNGSVAAHPGIMAQATFTGPVVTGFKFTGMGTFPPGGAPFSGTAANATSWDKMALNGVLHVIDRVLLPQ